ncbi:DgyrCDS3741 [Dimorphilus gyrociliatus]|uniref:DgyrCDS3741 n=1 Tax=Dimorphilus gyrociliatus TaxID=2664684 RepID=A0A7I8VET6_9ANNE|nr:DgyrCDS3741 [Dimorphilus gyrociliatus]
MDNSGLLQNSLEIKEYLRDIDAGSNKDEWKDLIGLCDNDDTGYSSPSTDILSAAIKKSGITKPKKTGKCVTKRYTRSSSFSDSNRPDMSYKEMVAKILLKSEKGQLSLKEITEQVAKDYEYYAKSKSNWPSSIRHTLSVADCFVKAGRAKGGRGFMWKIAEPYVKFFKEGDFDMKNISLSILPISTSTPKNEITNNAIKREESQHHQPIQSPNFLQNVASPQSDYFQPPSVASYTSDVPEIIESFDSLIPPIESDLSTSSNDGLSLYNNLQNHYQDQSNQPQSYTYSALMSAVDNYSLDNTSGVYHDCMYQIQQ